MPDQVPGAVLNPEPMLVSDPLLKQAEEACKRRLAKEPDNATVLASLAQTYRKQGNLTEAAAVYERLTALNPGDQVAAYMHAVFSGADIPAMPDGFRPAPFVLLKNFLPEAFHDALFTFALTLQEKVVPVRGMGGAYRPTVRESLELPGEWELKKRFRQRIRPIIRKVLSRLGVAPFEISEVEVKLRAYTDGHFFRIHMDCPPKQEEVCNRRVSYVYFFHKVPRAYSGGDLLLFDSDPHVAKSWFTTAGFTRVVPEDNCVIIFPSVYWHSVIPVCCPSKEFADSRFVVNGHVSCVSPKPVVQAPAEPVTAECGAVVAVSNPT